MAVDQTKRTAVRRTGSMASNWMQLGISFASLLLIAIVLNIFASQDALRLRLDATKTRAYSLSPRTQILLEQLTGKWTIALATLGSTADPALQRQIAEVLDRYEEANSNIHVMKVDLTDPRTLAEYDLLMVDLQQRYKTQIDAYDEALNDGLATYERFLSFAQGEVMRINQLLAGFQEDAPGMAQVDQVRRSLALLVNNATEILNPVIEARTVGVSQPIPDYELARSALAAAAQDAALKLLAAVRVIDELVVDPQVQRDLRSGMLGERSRFERLGDELTAVSDRLRRLPYLELTEIGRSLQTSEVAVIVGPQRATVISADLLFPAINNRLNESGEISFDMRFRGEQLLSAAIGSLLEDTMPLVVFVHASDSELDERTPQGLDFTGAISQLRSSRFEVKQWDVNKDPRPEPKVGQSVVWVIVPDPKRSGDIPDLQEEQQLIDAAQELINEGQPVLLTLFPSRLHQYDLTDPWAGLASALGVDAKVESMVIEQMATAQGEQPLHEMTLLDYQPGHPVAAAVHGLPTHFGFLIPLHPAGDDTNATRDVLLQVEPHQRLRLADAGDTQQVRTGEGAAMVTEAQPVALAIERENAVSGRQQRAVVVGSGFWLVSAILDQTVGEGGQKVRLRHPGNLELLIASVTWLAGLDDLIAQGPTSQEVARLRGVTPEVRTLWTWLTIVALPGLCVVAGIGVWLVRRS